MITLEELRVEIQNNQVTRRKLKEYLEGRLAALRIRNDSPMDEAKRNRLLGRLSEAKLLLTLDSPAPVVEKADDLI